MTPEGRCLVSLSLSFHLRRHDTSHTSSSGDRPPPLAPLGGGAVSADRTSLAGEEEAMERLEDSQVSAMEGASAGNRFPPEEELFTGQMVGTSQLLMSSRTFVSVRAEPGAIG